MARGPVCHPTKASDCAHIQWIRRNRLFQFKGIVQGHLVFLGGLTGPVVLDDDALEGEFLMCDLKTAVHPAHRAGRLNRTIGDVELQRVAAGNTQIITGLSRMRAPWTGSRTLAGGWPPALAFGPAAANSFFDLYKWTNSGLS